MAAKIDELAGNPELRGKLSTNARLTALAKFSQERFAAELVQFYPEHVPGGFPNRSSL